MSRIAFSWVPRLVTALRWEKAISAAGAAASRPGWRSYFRRACPTPGRCFTRQALSFGTLSLGHRLGREHDDGHHHPCRPVVFRVRREVFVEAQIRGPAGAHVIGGGRWGRLGSLPALQVLAISVGKFCAEPFQFRGVRLKIVVFPAEVQECGIVFIDFLPCTAIMAPPPRVRWKMWTQLDGSPRFLCVWRRRSHGQRLV